MTADELTVALLMDWDGRALSHDATLAEAESLHEAIDEAVQQHESAMLEFEPDVWG